VTDLNEFEAQQRTRDAAHELTVVKRELAIAKNQLTAARLEAQETAELLQRFGHFDSAHAVTPEWITQDPPSSATHHATAVLMLSDLHLDEVVNAAEMDGINEYNRAIAEQRVHRVVEGVVKLLKRYVAGVELDGLVLAILGDIITGVIHDELARTNEAPPSASVVYWVPVLASAILYLRDELGIPIHVPCVDGNHDRFYGKPHHKQRATTSLAWIIYNWLADHLDGEEGITFSLTQSAEQVVTVYNTRLMLSHGDSFRSQGGVGGLYPSLLKWLLRRHQQYSDTSDDFDFALIGHWHQTLAGQDFFVNGSLKGYDEYAKALGFTFERPQQSLFLVTPERSVVQRLPVHAE
jgi:predicted phosphodiesterase